MASIGRKILSAFVEVADEEKITTPPREPGTGSANNNEGARETMADNGKFRMYFDKLFEDANLPGPDYYEFSKMTAAMTAITDENARYSAAFAGLQVQGLNRNQLLLSAKAYLELLEKDAATFLTTVDNAVKEKVNARQQEITVQTERMQQITQEIAALQNSVAVLKREVEEQEQKIARSTGGYKQAMEAAKQRIAADMEKIKLFIQ
jgi:uncharacterized protein YoxC